MDVLLRRAFVSSEFSAYYYTLMCVFVCVSVRTPTNPELNRILKALEAHKGGNANDHIGILGNEAVVMQQPHSLRPVLER